MKFKGLFTKRADPTVPRKEAPDQSPDIDPRDLAAARADVLRQHYAQKFDLEPNRTELTKEMLDKKAKALVPSKAKERALREAGVEEIPPQAERDKLKRFDQWEAKKRTELEQKQALAISTLIGRQKDERKRIQLQLEEHKEALSRNSKKLQELNRNAEGRRSRRDSVDEEREELENNLQDASRRITESESVLTRQDAEMAALRQKHDLETSELGLKIEVAREAGHEIPMDAPVHSRQQNGQEI